MFATLEDNERNIVIDAMEERKFAGEVVIKQGDDGAELLLWTQELCNVKNYSLMKQHLGS